jgi:hypothetical protein
VIVLLYQTDRRQAPALNFMRALEADDYDAWAKIRRLLAIVWETEPGAPLRLPRDASERLRGGAFALRVRGTELWARLFYVYGQPSEIVLLDGIYKQSNQTPEAAIARAEALAADYARRGTADPYWASKPK